MKKILMVSYFLWAQLFYLQMNNVIDNNIQDVAPPEISNIMKYADFPENDFIGKVNISVPIYKIKFGSLEIPIEFSYNTKGNKVADIATRFGLGWNLIAGGAIIPKINDINDLSEAYFFSSDDGYYHAWDRYSKGFLTDDYPTELESHSVKRGKPQLCGNHNIRYTTDQMIDAAPDFYYTNAPGLNDKFYLKKTSKDHFNAVFFKQTKAKLKNDYLKLEPNIILCRTSESYYGSVGAGMVLYMPEKLELIGENGYSYVFNTPSYSVIKEFPETATSHEFAQVTDWGLSEIKDPYTERKVKFEYEYESELDNYEHLALITFDDINMGDYKVAKNYEVGSFQEKSGHENVNNKIVSTKLFPKRLKKIITDQEIIDFIYSFHRKDYPTKGLDKIIIKNINEKIIKEIKLKYSYFETPNCDQGVYECNRLKLESIHDSSIGTYSFSYKNEKFPARNSSKVDFLGYFNNNPSNIIFSKNYIPAIKYYPSTKVYFYPDLKKDFLLPFPLINKQYYSFSGDIDRSASYVSQLGLLTRIIYPTGGMLEINYENDDFIYEGEQYILGSTRVNEMKLYDNKNNISQIKRYKYINENKKSSGQINFFTAPHNVLQTKISVGIGFNTDAIIGYSRIIEEEIGKGYVEKKFTNFNDYPDILMKHDHNFDDIATKNFIKFFKFPSSYVQSFEERRGKLISINHYIEGNRFPIKKQKYIYTYTPKDSLKVTKIFSSYNGNRSGSRMEKDYSASNHILRYFNNMSKQIIEEDYNNKIIKKEIEFYYNDNRLIHKKINQKGNIEDFFYRNSEDKNIIALQKANIFDKTIEIEKRSNGILIEKKEEKYDAENSILPTSSLSYDLENHSKTNQNITYNQYDNKGNLIEYKLNGITPVVIIWGYHQTLPIAKIEGATYDQVKNLVSDIISKSNEDKDEVSEKNLITALDNFRNKEELKNFQVTTYTHNPLIGVTSITPPSGIREIYKYDDANRLKQVLDIHGNILKEYNYHYTGAENEGTGTPSEYKNTALSRKFTKNNCTEKDYVGTEYTYNVPSGKYVSTISQADADQKAFDEIDANGQNEANRQGTCYKVYYNNEKRKVFSKKDCPSGNNSTAYTYIVPAKKYLSKISQDDADQKAEEEIKNGGQKQADQRLRCIPSQCAVTPIENPVFVLDKNTKISIKEGKIFISPPIQYKDNWLPFTERVIGMIEDICIPDEEIRSSINNRTTKIKPTGEVLFNEEIEIVEFKN